MVRRRPQPPTRRCAGLVHGDECTLGELVSRNARDHETRLRGRCSITCISRLLSSEGITIGLRVLPSARVGPRRSDWADCRVVGAICWLLRIACDPKPAAARTAATAANACSSHYETWRARLGFAAMYSRHSGTDLQPGSTEPFSRRASRGGTWPTPVWCRACRKAPRLRTSPCIHRWTAPS